MQWHRRRTFWLVLMNGQAGTRNAVAAQSLWRGVPTSNSVQVQEMCATVQLPPPRGVATVRRKKRKRAGTVRHRSVRERPSRFLGAATLCEDRVATPRRFAVGVDHLHIVLPSRIAGGLRVQSRGAEVARCLASGTHPLRRRLVATAGLADQGDIDWRRIDGARANQVSAGNDTLVMSVRNLGYSRNAGEFVRKYLNEIGPRCSWHRPNRVLCCPSTTPASSPAQNDLLYRPDNLLD